MGQLYVYDPWPEAVDTLGLCGPLTPKTATCTQEKNGDFRLDIEHPIDGLGKWAKLVPGNLIKADVPLRTMPLIRDVQYYYMLNPTRYTVQAGASRTNRSVFSAAPYARNGVIPTPVRFAVLEPCESAYVTRTVSDWSQIVWRGGRGWVLTSALASAGTTTLASTRDATETALPSPKTRMQLFRVQSVKLTDNGISAVARHASYDIANSLVSLLRSEMGDANLLSPLNSIVGSSWLGGILSHAWVDGFTNDSTTLSDSFSGWTRTGKIEALLGASNSVVACWNVAILRDNWLISAISDPAYASGYAIEYAKNLRGVSYDVDASDIQSALLPVGQTSKGNPLTIPTGTYTVDGVATTVTNGIIQGANDTYPIPHIGVLDLGSAVKASGTSEAQKLEAYTKLIRAVRKKFADEKCDLPPVTLNVDFLNLGDTAEYAQYHDLQKLFLYDTVRVKDPRLGIDVTTEVNKTEWDCLLDRYNKIELGSVRKNYARTRLAGWQIPGLASLQAYVDTISSLI